MENRSIWLVSGRSPHKAALCGDPGISKLPGEVNSPGSKVFARGKNAWTRQKVRGRRAALSATCRDSCFKFGCSIIRTSKINPSDWSPANRRRHPRLSKVQCGSWRPWGMRRMFPWDARRAPHGDPLILIPRAKLIRPAEILRACGPLNFTACRPPRRAGPRYPPPSRTWKTDPSGSFPEGRRKLPRLSKVQCGSWRPWGRRRIPPQWR